MKKKVYVIPQTWNDYTHQAWLEKMIINFKGEGIIELIESRAEVEYSELFMG